jgi:phytanoyl-CoA hydroxylase
MLAQHTIDQYRDEGAVVIPGLMDAATLSQIRSVLAQLIERSREVIAHDSVYDLEPGHSAVDPRVRRIKKPHAIAPVFYDFVRSDAVANVLRALIGPAARLHNSKLNLKSPRYGSPVEWHQDWAFYPHTNDDVLAIGVMLDDTTLENGAMLVVPGTHKHETYDHHGPDGHFCGAMNPDTCGVDFRKTMPCVGEAGSCSFHHVRLVHGSAQNTSDKPRGLLLYEVCAADAFPLMGVTNFLDFQSRMLYGADTLTPRFCDGHVRMPLPPAKNQGSIYENQSAAKRYFAVTAN